MNYTQFLESKKHSTIEYGINSEWFPDGMFDFQKYITERTIKKGRYANFLDTGTGKTLIELTVAHNYVKATNKPVLIITPLAVADQHVKESEKFGIPDVYHTKDGNYKKKIVLINYERLHYLNPCDFDCVILDESSILKNFNGKIKEQITSFLKRVKYRYLFTATPSPNDFIELGTSSEALGYLGYTDMLGRFFGNNENNIRPQDIGNKWYLKPHAYNDFFEWVSSWSISMRKPSDLGFSDELFILPELITNNHFVRNDKNWIVDGQIMMFSKIAKRQSEIVQEQKMTIENRCNKAVELASSHDTSVYWCNFNMEGDLLSDIDKNAIQITGSMKIEKKEEILKAFADGQIKKLITKPKMTAFGLNWQHCNHTVYFPTFSYEQYYQSIRRFWRFGQKNEVVVDRVLSDGQKRIMDAIEIKTSKAIELFDKLNSTLNKTVDLKQKEFIQNINKPVFL
jgi:superfamily II DNA or RNA helicase